MTQAKKKPICAKHGKQWAEDQARKSKQRREYWNERERLERTEAKAAELVSELQSSSATLGVLTRDLFRDLNKARLSLRLILSALSEQRSASATLRIVKRHAKRALESEI